MAVVTVVDGTMEFVAVVSANTVTVSNCSTVVSSTESTLMVDVSAIYPPRFSDSMLIPLPLPLS